jgi:hypothetical protein
MLGASTMHGTSKAVGSLTTLILDVFNFFKSFRGMEWDLFFFGVFGFFFFESHHGETLLIRNHRYIICQHIYKKI